MTDSVKEAIKDLSDDAFMLESGAGNNISTPKKMAAQIRLLITAAQGTERLRGKYDIAIADWKRDLEISKQWMKSSDEYRFLLAKEQDLNTKLRARIAEQIKDFHDINVLLNEAVGRENVLKAQLEKDRPEVVTVEYFAEELGVLLTDKNYRTEVAKYLSFYYPNGLIVQDKEGVE